MEEEHLISVVLWGEVSWKTESGRRSSEMGGREGGGNGLGRKRKEGVDMRRRGKWAGEEEEGESRHFQEEETQIVEGK